MLCLAYYRPKTCLLWMAHIVYCCQKLKYKYFVKGFFKSLRFEIKVGINKMDNGWKWIFNGCSTKIKIPLGKQRKIIAQVAMSSNIRYSLCDLLLSNAWRSENSYYLPSWNTRRKCLDTWTPVVYNAYKI